MIDLVGLPISVSELLWTIVSFFLFLFLLKRFLYEPILSVMDARNAKVSEGMAEGKAAERELAENRERLSAELTAAGGEARAVIANAKAGAEKEKSARLASSHIEASRVHKDVRERISAEEKAEQAELGAELPELVALLAGRLTGEELDAGSELIRDCIESSGEA